MTQRDLSSVGNACTPKDIIDGLVIFPRFEVHGVVLSDAYTPFSLASCSRLTGKNIAAHIVAKTSEAQAYMYLTRQNLPGCFRSSESYHPFSSRCVVYEVSSPG